MKISIITVNLNNRTGLAKTLQSVFERQGKFSDFEQIVIDGGSSDGSVDVITSYTGRLAYWVSEPDGGIYNAMNKGVSKATGEYLLFLNSGDWLNDNVLEQTIPELSGADVLYGDQMIHSKGKYTLWSLPKACLISESFFANGSIPHSGSFIKASLFMNKKYDESYSIIADLVFFHNALTHGAVFKKTDCKLSVFEHGGISTNPKMREKHDAELERFNSTTFGPKALPFIRDRMLLTQILGSAFELAPITPSDIPTLRHWIGLFYFLNRTPMLRRMPKAIALIMDRHENKRL